MTTTTETHALTEQHRLAQLGVRAAALRDFLLLWPLWQGDSRSFANLVLATEPLVATYRSLSASVAAAYYQAVREAQDATGTATPTLAAAIDQKQLTASLYVTGEAMTRKALRSGMGATQARDAALARVSGAVGRHVLNSGRQTVIDSIAADPDALGWARITDSEPCAFCALLASRGAVYKSEATADFHAHDHCGCSIMPVYRGSRLPDSNRRWRSLYDRAQREAEMTGELDRGTTNDRLNAFRRLLEADRAGAQA